MKYPENLKTGFYLNARFYFKTGSKKCLRSKSLKRKQNGAAVEKEENAGGKGVCGFEALFTLTFRLTFNG